MKIATIDKQYLAEYINKEVIVKDVYGTIIGKQAYTLEYRPVAGFDAIDQVAMEEIAVKLVDESLKKEIT